MIHLIDVAAWADPNFEVQGGFKSYWRTHVWEGWLACNLVMVGVNIIIIAASVVQYLAVKRFPVYYEYNITKGYLAFLICFVLTNLGVACYQYSWYGPNTWRMPYLVFTFLYYLIRFLGLVTCCIIVHSRIAEMDYEIKYGEKKILPSHPSRDLLTSREYLDMRRAGSQSQLI